MTKETGEKVESRRDSLEPWLPLEHAPDAVGPILDRLVAERLDAQRTEPAWITGDAMKRLLVGSRGEETMTRKKAVPGKGATKQEILDQEGGRDHLACGHVVATITAGQTGKARACPRCEKVAARQ